MELKVIENQLIPIYENDQNEHLINARELHEFLEVQTEFRHWFPRMCEYGFIENVDYTPFKFDHPQNKQEVTDYNLTLAMAKEVSMLQRNEKGKLARQYFIKIEEDWNRPEKVMARAIKIAERTINNLQIDIQQMKPKVEFYDIAMQSDDLLDIGQVAKILNIKNLGRNNLFFKLRELKIFDQYNMPYQKYVDSGYFKVVEVPKIAKGVTSIYPKPCVYQKGLDFIRKAVIQ